MLCPAALRATVLYSTPPPGEQSAVIDMALFGVCGATIIFRGRPATSASFQLMILQ